MTLPHGAAGTDDRTRHARDSARRRRAGSSASSPAGRTPSPRREVQVAASFLADLLGYLRQRGVDAEAVARRAAVAVHLAAGGAVPGTRVAALWHAALDITADPDLGLHAAEAFAPGALDIVGYVMLSAPTAAEALRLGARYVRLLNDGLALDVACEDGVAGPLLVYRLTLLEHLDNFVARDARVGRQVIETVLAGLVRQARLLAERDRTARPLVPQRVRLRHPLPPTGAAEHARTFGVAPQFGAAVDEVAFAAAELGGPVRSANPALLAAFARHADDALAARAAADTLAGRVLAEVTPRLRGEAPALGAVARALAVSARHLQRGLQAEGTTYGAVLDQARQALAERHLAAPGATVAQVAFLLGYSEPSAFQRAYRRWTGEAPGARRRRAAPG
jgi:AraC-like DNA-binding protein